MKSLCAIAQSVDQLQQVYTTYMNIVQSPAWIGTGLCDPDKDIKQALIALAIVAGWGIIIYLLNRLSKSKQSKSVKISVSILVILAAAAATFVIGAMTLIVFACSRYA